MAGNGSRPGLLARLAGYRPESLAEREDLVLVRELANSPDPWDRAAPVHLTGSALIVHPPSGRVLLRWHDRLAAWLQVGGHGDPGETDPLAVALREAVEETGLTDLVPWPDSSIRQVAVVPVPPSGREPAHRHADVRFVLATAHPDDAVPERPGAPLRWLAVAEAVRVTTDANLGEALSRVGRLLGTA